MRVMKTRALAAIAAALLLAGCKVSSTPIERLDQDYHHGKQARASLIRHGKAVTDQSCTDMYTATGAGKGDSSQDKKWLEQRQTSYVNGCMDRPNTGITDTPRPSPSAG